MYRLARFALILTLAAVAGFGFAASASAQFGATLTLTPSTTAVNAHPDLTLTTDFVGTPKPSDVTLKLPAGLRIAPGAIETPCPIADAEAGDCDPSTLIGSASVTLASGSPAAGELFLTEAPSSNLVAGVSLNVELPGGDGSFIAQAGLDLNLNGAFTVSGAPTSDQHQRITFPELPLTSSTGVSIQLTQLSMSFTGALGGSFPLITNPSACPAVADTASATLVADDLSSATAIAQYPVTDCAPQTIDPTFSASLTNPTANAPTGARFTATVAPESSALRAIVLKLGTAIWLNTVAYGATADMCPTSSVTTLSRFNPDSCPAQAQVGTVRLTTPMFREPIDGKLWVVNMSPIPVFAIDIGESNRSIRAAGWLSFPQIDPSCDSFWEYCEVETLMTFQLPSIPATKLELDLGQEGRVNTSGTPLSPHILRIVSPSEMGCVSPNDVRMLVATYANWTTATRTESLSLMGCNSGSPVDTQITSAPPAETNDNQPTIEFDSDPTGQADSFECKIDDGTFAACESPWTVPSALADGVHSISVRSLNQFGHDPTPAVAEFVVDEGPDTSIAGPSSPSDDRTPQLIITSSDPSATFECSVDAAPFEICASSFTPPLVDGEHEVRARAVSENGAKDATPALFTILIETGPPMVTFEKSERSQRYFEPEDVSIQFSADEPAEFICSIDDGEYLPCESPLAPPMLEDGAHALRVVAIDAAFNSSTSFEFEFFVIGVAPTVEISQQTSSEEIPQAMTFDFHTVPERSAVECRIDDEPFADCEMSYPVESLAAGEHTISARAMSYLGVPGPTTTLSFSLEEGEEDLTTSLVQPIPAAGSSRRLDVELTSNDSSAGFECSEDAESWAPCAAPFTWMIGAESTDGTYTFFARARNGEMVDPSPLEISYILDTEAPSPTIQTNLDTNSQLMSGELQLTLGSNESSSWFECSLDGFVASCSQDETFSDLTAGNHSLAVRAIDAAGNVSRWVRVEFNVISGASPNVDVLPPETTIHGLPPGERIRENELALTLEASETSTFHCSINAAEFSECSAEMQLSNLEEGANTFAAYAVDEDANADPTPASVSFIVDTVPPTTAITLPDQELVYSSLASIRIEYSSSESPARFECSVNLAPFIRCAPGQRLASLIEGTNTIRVRSVDEAGNHDLIGDELAVVLMTSPPLFTRIVAGPGENEVVTLPVLFEFDGEANAGFECSFNGGEFEICDRELSLSSVPDGNYSVSVRARNNAGGTDPTPVTRNFIVDATAPETMLDSVSNALSDIHAPVIQVDSENIRFGWSSSEWAVSFICRLDGGPFRSCPDGQSINLAAGLHSIETKAVDAVGNEDPTPLVLQVEVTPPSSDSVPPETSFDEQVTPSQGSTLTEPSLPYRALANEPSWFECSVDAEPFSHCPAGGKTARLANGPHVLRVRAVDGAGNTDSDPAEISFDTEVSGPPAPAVQSELLVPNPHRGTNPIVGFESLGDQPDGFECKAQGRPWEPCVSPHKFNLPHAANDGNVGFSVRSIVGDAVGPSSDVLEYQLDRTAPVTPLLTVTPDNDQVLTEDSIEFAFQDPPIDAIASCSIDSAPFTSCASPVSMVDLDDGPHTFAIRYIDAAGNVGSSATRRFIVDTAGELVSDTTAPQTWIVDGPALNVSSSVSPQFTFSASEPVEFECSVDNTEFEDCESAMDTAAMGLIDGEHSVEVRARDIAGNVDSSPASSVFVIDTIAPAAPSLDSQIPEYVAGSSIEIELTPPADSFITKCKLDFGPWSECDGDFRDSGLSSGAHEFQAKSVDRAGNESAVTQASWTQDAEPPPQILWANAFENREGELTVQWDDSATHAEDFDSYETRACSAPVDDFATECDFASEDRWSDWQPSEEPTKKIGDGLLSAGTAAAVEIRASDSRGNRSMSTFAGGIVSGSPPDIADPGPELTKLDGEYLQSLSLLASNLTVSDDDSGVKSVAITADRVDDPGPSLQDLQSQTNSDCDDQRCSNVFLASFPGQTHNLAEGAWRLIGTASDRAGNATNRVLATIRIDTTAPLAPAEFDVSYNGDAKIAELDWDEPEDPSIDDLTQGSGVESSLIRYRLNGSSWSEWTVTDDPMIQFNNVDIGDVIDAEFRSIDQVGNESAVATFSETVEYDPHSTGYIHMAFDDALGHAATVRSVPGALMKVCRKIEGQRDRCNSLRSRELSGTLHHKASGVSIKRGEVLMELNPGIYRIYAYKINGRDAPEAGTRDPMPTAWRSPINGKKYYFKTIRVREGRVTSAWAGQYGGRDLADCAGPGNRIVRGKHCGRFNVAKAVDYALEYGGYSAGDQVREADQIDRDAPEIAPAQGLDYSNSLYGKEGDNDCTNFLSQILRAGGVSFAHERWTGLPRRKRDGTLYYTWPKADTDDEDNRNYFAFWFLKDGRPGANKVRERTTSWMRATRFIEYFESRELIEKYADRPRKSQLTQINTRPGDIISIDAADKRRWQDYLPGKNPPNVNHLAFVTSTTDDPISGRRLPKIAQHSKDRTDYPWRSYFDRWNKSEDDGYSPNTPGWDGDGTNTWTFDRYRVVNTRFNSSSITQSAQQSGNSSDSESEETDGAVAAEENPAITVAGSGETGGGLHTFHVDTSTNFGSYTMPEDTAYEMKLEYEVCDRYVGFGAVGDVLSNCRMVPICDTNTCGDEFDDPLFGLPPESSSWSFNVPENTAPSEVIPSTLNRTLWLNNPNQTCRYPTDYEYEITPTIRWKGTNGDYVDTEGTFRGAPIAGEYTAHWCT